MTTTCNDLGPRMGGMTQQLNTAHNAVAKQDYKAAAALLEALQFQLAAITHEVQFLSRDST